MSMANADRCAVCGGMFALIGRVHRCIPRCAVVTVPQTTRDQKELPDSSSESSSTYRYRSTDDRRAYMRDYMKRKRAKKD